MPSRAWFLSNAAACGKALNHTVPEITQKCCRWRWIPFGSSARAYHRWALSAPHCRRRIPHFRFGSYHVPGAYLSVQIKLIIIDRCVSAMYCYSIFALHAYSTPAWCCTLRRIWIPHLDPGNFRRRHKIDEWRIQPQHHGTVTCPTHSALNTVHIYSLEFFSHHLIRFWWCGRESG